MRAKRLIIKFHAPEILYPEAYMEYGMIKPDITKNTCTPNLPNEKKSVTEFGFIVGNADPEK